MARDLASDLARLGYQYELAMNEVVMLLSLTFGYGDPEALTAYQRAELECEADELAKNWADAETGSTAPAVKTVLQALLRTQYELGDQLSAAELERWRQKKI